MHFIGSYVIDILAFAESKGFDSGPIWSQMPHSKDQLGEKDFFVDYALIAQVLDRVVEGLSNPHFGLQMGEVIMLHATQYIDQMIDSSADVQAAFQNAVAYSRMISDSMQCALVLEPEHFKVNFEMNPDWAVCSANAIQQNLDVALVCTMKSLQRLTATNYRPVSVHFHYPRPKSWNEYYRIFDCPIRFGQSVSSIGFDQRVLGAAVRSQDAGLLEQMRQQAEEILIHLPEEKAMSYLVKKAILNASGPFDHQIDAIAERLGMGTRTLQRSLKKEQTTFKTIHGELRKKLALRMLKHESRTVSEVAYLLGFSEVSAFTRAFKQWTGVSPRSYLNATGK